MGVRGVRGAITVGENTPEAILEGTTLMIQEIIQKNELNPDDVASVILTVTPDLNATFPARAVRAIPGWELVPLMCTTEIPVPGSLPLCIRTLILFNTDKSLQEIRHVFLGGAKVLRPDLQTS
jgi:chorismate mutase